MPTLGLYMIAKNEEEVIERCLSSFIGDGSIFDQVVLVDTGSTDRTKEIAKKFGCEVYDFKWVNDFSKARNFSLSKVHTQWAMWCDLDDVLLEKDFQKLKQLKPNLSKDMYLLPYDYFQDENGKSLCTLYRERIIKNNPKFTWNYPIHECMAMLPGASVEQIEIIITHKRTNAGQTADLSRNIKMLDEAIKKPEYAKDPRVQYYLAKECFDACQWERATTELSKFIDMNSGWYEDVICALHKLAECYRVTAKNDLAKQIAFKAIGMDYKWAEPYYVLGMLAMDAKDWKQAIHWFEMCRRPLPQVLSPTRPDYYTWLPNLQLCVCYNAVGDLQKSHERNAEALKQNPKNATIIQNDKWLKKTLSTKNNPPKEIRVGWYVLGIDLNVPQFRIRTHNINKHLQGCKSEIFTDASRIKEFDVIIFDVMFNERDYNIIAQAKDMGKCVLVNVCEALFEFNNPWYTKSMEIADIVICCSEALKKLVSEKVPTAKITCHEDAVETDYRTNCSYEDKQNLVVGWCGMGGGAYRVEKLRPLFEKHGYKLVTIHEHANADIKWDLNTWQSELVKCDIAVAPTDYLIQPCKSNNKLTTYMALGLPVICSPLHAYARLINDGQNAFIADNDEQWEKALIALKDVNVRRSVGQAGKAISHAYSLPVIASYWKNTIVDCFSKMEVKIDYNGQEPIVDIIIPTYDNPKYLEECIKSIKECTDVPYNIIIIDAKAEKTNFSQSINLGISRGKAPYVCFLNDDTIVSHGWIKPLIEQIKGNVGFCNPLSNCDRGFLHNYNLSCGGLELGPGTNKLVDGKIVCAGDNVHFINPSDIYSIKSPSGRTYVR